MKRNIKGGVFIEKSKKNRKIKILVTFIIIFFLLSNQIYAKYNYQIILDAFYLNRDTSEIIYQIEKSVPDDEYTNKDVTLNIIANKPIEEVEGFVLDESRTKLTKTVSQNEEKNIVLEDLSGNKKEAVYYISNIDKQPPQILGIENGKTYNQKMSVEYADNVGIEDIQIDRYSNRLVIRCIQDYYNSAYYEGLDVLGEDVFVDFIEYPKEAAYFHIFVNNSFRIYTERTNYKVSYLSFGTPYTIKVNAYNSNKELIATASEDITTKCFNKIKATKTEDTFEIEIKEICENVSLGTCSLWYEGIDYKTYPTTPTMNSDRSVKLSFNAYQIDGTKSSDYYYFQLQFVSNTNSNLNQTLRMNIKFDETYVDNRNKIDPNNLDKNGIYDITVTDLAGNQTTKSCTIQL